MTDKRIVVVRHGRTADNHAKRIQGQRDTRLDEVGRAQAKAVAAEIAAYDPVLLVSSDLSRAAETAQAIADETRLATSHDERLREFRLGDAQGMTHDEYAAIDPDAFERFRSGDWDFIPGAETWAEVGDRWAAALRDVAAALSEGQTAVVVSHGAATRVGTAAFLGWPLELGRSLNPLGNCARIELVEKHTAWVSGWLLGAYNLPRP